MRLTVKNIAKIQEASIQLDGITVIAGKNNTGKSTIGKALYCMFNSFYDSSNKIEREKQRFIRATIWQYLRQYPIRTMDKLMETIQKELNDLEITSESQKEEIRNIIEENLSKYKGKTKNDTKSLTASISNISLEDVTNRLYLVFSIEWEFFQKTIIERHVNEEFKSQINHVNHQDELCTIEVEIKGNTIKIDYLENECYSIQKNIDITVEALYYDSPFVLDYASNEFEYEIESGHQNFLKSKLLNNFENDIIEETLKRKKLEIILQKIKMITSGDISEDDDDNNVFMERGLSEPLSFSNLSTGLKTFVILERLIEQNQFEDKGVLILDEPEVHLHPEWQLKFAEILVMLQKELDLNVLLATHSPYFLKAIEVYSRKYKNSEKCNYYLAELDDKNYAKFRNVNENTEPIYELLAMPLQTLEDVIWS